MFCCRWRTSSTTKNARGARKKKRFYSTCAIDGKNWIFFSPSSPRYTIPETFGTEKITHNQCAVNIKWNPSRAYCHSRVSSMAKAHVLRCCVGAVEKKRRKKVSCAWIYLVKMAIKKTTTTTRKRKSIKSFFLPCFDNKRRAKKGRNRSWQRKMWKARRSGKQCDITSQKKRSKSFREDEQKGEKFRALCWCCANDF